jgi:hypothetical protein
LVAALQDETAILGDSGIVHSGFHPIEVVAGLVRVVEVVGRLGGIQRLEPATPPLNDGPAQLERSRPVL